MNTATAIIVDDEPNACHYLKIKLNTFFPEIKIVGIGNNCEDAKLLLSNCQPDLAFLDIQMRGKNSIEMLNALPELKTKIIFITAFEKYAISAIKLKVLDYLLKPINDDDLISAVNNFYIEKDRSEILWSEIKEDKFIRIREKREEYFVHLKDIIMMEGLRGYTKISFKLDGKWKTSTSSYPLSHYETILPPKIFLRTHKSFIVNKFFVRSIFMKECLTLQLTSEHKVIVSKRREKEILGLLGRTIQ